ncbi:hypothetical protein sscle_03g022680 [Sclerotinia sclerotiorum 1980 UF-70]|uniref:Uncharacterized protein n=1 Tax=Sclerotinia sclerotiorum (strain ATCC 18683 / 1980 / Ss-1) TaxID=665079 RepID=A0A1D9PXQ4_SCLS1|nr:hypothetical protein sscle_03g022680 [Sclerotinia sclerotiorum 1980 UF-70]
MAYTHCYNLEALQDTGLAFKILAGIGSRAGLQMAIMALQAVVTPEELLSTISFIIFA